MVSWQSHARLYCFLLISYRNFLTGNNYVCIYNIYAYIWLCQTYIYIYRFGRVNSILSSFIYKKMEMPLYMYEWYIMHISVLLLSWCFDVPINFLPITRYFRKVVMSYCSLSTKPYILPYISYKLRFSTACLPNTLRFHASKLCQWSYGFHGGEYYII